MKIAITGEKGFMGINLTNYFRHILKYEVVELGRDYLSSIEKIRGVDWLIHGACTHRHEIPEVVVTSNHNLNKATIDLLLEHNIKCNVAFLSSVHEDSQTPYGLSKREGKMMFEDYCNTVGSQLISYKIPNVFGRYASPFKTSFIATFCYNFHHELPSNFNQNKIELCYIDDVVAIISKFEDATFPYVETSVDTVHSLLATFHNAFKNNEMPVLKSKFELDLYHTYKSYQSYTI